MIPSAQLRRTSFHKTVHTSKPYQSTPYVRFLFTDFFFSARFTVYTTTTGQRFSAAPFRVVCHLLHLHTGTHCACRCCRLWRSPKQPPSHQLSQPALLYLLQKPCLSKRHRWLKKSSLPCTLTSAMLQMRLASTSAITALGFLLALMLRETPLRTSEDYAAAREEAAGDSIG